MMKPFSAADGPRAEVSGTLPAVLPVAPGAPIASADIAASLESLRAQADNVAARAALAFAGERAGQRAAALLAEKSVDRSGLYDLARRVDEEGDVAGAVDLLTLLAGLPDGETDGFLGLAVLAMRDARFDIAADLAEHSLHADERHPRVCSLAGILELSRGNRPAAQAWLATASRIARRRPEYRQELQLAQRALLLMHLG